MLDGKRLLTELARLRKRLEDDLRRHHAASQAGAALQAEWREAFDAKRTADTFETFFAGQDEAAAQHRLPVVFHLD